MNAVVSFLKGLVHPDTITRTAKTFVAAAVAAFSLPAASVYNAHAWESAALAAATAGVTAVWNGGIKAFTSAVEAKAKALPAPVAAVVDKATLDLSKAPAPPA